MAVPKEVLDAYLKERTTQSKVAFEQIADEIANCRKILRGEKTV